MRKWGPLLAVCLGTTMLLLDVTIVTVALPAMAGSLHVQLTGLQWVIDVYALALAALLLSAGSLADLLGRRRLFLVGMVVFAVGSLACGLAPTAGLLITARAVQGVGGTAMFATALSLLGSTYQGRDRGTALGVWGAVSGAAAAAGPIVGGVLTESLSWRWIFLVNLPISVVAFVLTKAVVAESRGQQGRRIDYAGMATLTVAASATTYAIITGDTNGWISLTTLGIFTLAAVASVAFILVEWRISDPMLDLRLFRRPSFVGVMLAGFAFQIASFSVLAYASIWMQSMLGYSALQTGLVQFPLSLASFVVALLAGRRLHGVSPRYVIAVALLIIAVGDWAQAVLSVTSPAIVLIPGMVLVGIGVGLMAPSISGAALGAVSPERAGMAGGALNTARQLGLALGVAVFGTITVAAAQRALTGQVGDPHATAQALFGGAGRALVAAAPQEQRTSLDLLLHNAFASGLNTAMVAAGLVSALAAVVVFVLMRTKKPSPERSVGSGTPELPPSVAVPAS